MSVAVPPPATLSSATAGHASSSAGNSSSDAEVFNLKDRDGASRFATAAASVGSPGGLSVSEGIEALDRRAMQVRACVRAVMQAGLIIVC